MNATPPIVLSRLDADRLDRMLETLPANAFAGRADLERELDRATVLEPAEMPSNVVTMNSTVRFEMAASGEVFSLRLVYPQDVDASGGTISILAPVGTALLGLAEGAEIDWPRPGGGMTRVRLIKVLYQPERSGDFAR